MSDLERKLSQSVQLKSGDQGLARVQFAQPDGRTIDKDYDLTLPGAWPDGAVVAVSPFGHRSVTEGAIPAGRAVMRADGTADVKLFMETQAGRDTYVAMKELRDHVELSYGFRILELGDLTPELRQRGARRVLKKLDVLELSPVLRGAAAHSQVLAIKAAPVAPDPVAVKAVERFRAWSESQRERHGPLAWDVSNFAARELSHGAVKEGPVVCWFDYDGERAGYFRPGEDAIHISRGLEAKRVISTVAHEVSHWWRLWDASEESARSDAEWITRRYLQQSNAA